MLKIEMANGKGAVIQAEGPLGEILTEFCIAFNKVFHSIVKTDTEAAEEIKMVMKMAILDNNSPFWRDLGLEGEESITHIKVSQM